MIKLLEGVRVIESARLLNGDTLGMFLAGFGADVIKIEDTERGDYLRDILGTITPHHSVPHLQCNAGKRSVAVDLRSQLGLEVFWRLLATADIFVDGNMPDTCQRLGIGYEQQRARQASIVYCQYTGFGANGPYSAIPSHGISMNALAGDTPVEMGEDGWMHKASSNDCVPRRGPEATIAGALWAAYYVVSALLRQRRTGMGCFVDVSAADAVVATTGLTNVYALNRERLTDLSTLPAFDRGGELTGAKYQYYESRDGLPMLFACMEHKFWINFCAAVGRPDLGAHANSVAILDFAVDPELRRELQNVFHTRTRSEWVKLAAGNDFSIVPVTQDVNELLEDPHVGARSLFYEGHHPHAGPFTYLGVPGVIPGESFEVIRPAPLHGEHTLSVLAEIGYGGTEIDAFLVGGIVRQA